MTPAARSATAGILCGGLIAGTVDIGAACLINGLSPTVILQAVASGLLGQDSYRGGLPVAVFGYVLQCAMSVVIAACYATGTQWLPATRTHWVAAGLAFGIVIFGVMNYFVVPLSAVGRRPYFTTASFVGNLLAMFLFGVIVAYFFRNAPRGAAANTPPGPSSSSSDGGRPAGISGPGASDRALDEALDESFPASDPVAIHVDTESPSDTAAPAPSTGGRSDD